jgi:hypothetical protein
MFIWNWPRADMTSVPSSARRGGTFSAMVMPIYM